MINQFLQIIQAGNVQSQLEIAQKLKISPQMVLQVAEELTRLGYLEAHGGNCDTPKSACAGCPVDSGCGGSYRNWSLTEKGQKAAAAR